MRQSKATDTYLCPISTNAQIQLVRTRIFVVCNSHLSIQHSDLYILAKIAKIRIDSYKYALNKNNEKIFVR